MSSISTEQANARWIDGLRAGGERGERALGELRAFLLRRLRAALGAREGVDESLLEDFVQEATLRVHARLDGFRGDSRFTTWASAVAMRVAFTELRRARWKDRPVDELEEQTPLELDEPGPEQSAARREVGELLRRTIEEALTPRQQAVLRAELAGTPSIVIAERLGTNQNALYKLVHDARKKLRRALLDAGFSESELRAAYDGDGGS